MQDRDLNRDFSTSFEMKFGKFGTYKQNWNFLYQNYSPLLGGMVNPFDGWVAPFDMVVVPGGYWGTLMVAPFNGWVAP